MSEQDKTYPTHRLTWAEKYIDQNGEEKLGRPVEVGAVWPRKDPEKSGGIVEFNLKNLDLNNGVMFQHEVERQQQQDPHSQVHQRQAEQAQAEQQAAELQQQQEQAAAVQSQDKGSER